MNTYDTLNKHNYIIDDVLLCLADDYNSFIRDCKQNIYSVT